MTLLLTDEDLRPLFFGADGIAGLIDAVGAAFREDRAQPREGNRTVSELLTEGLSLLTIALNSPAFGVSVRAQVRGPNGRPLVGPDGPLPQTVQLFDPASGTPVAILCTSDYEYVRTAVPTAVACRYLAPPDPKVLGVIGSSTQARGHIPVLLQELAGIEEVRIFSPTRQHREGLAEEMNAKLQATVRAVDGPRDAIEEADVVAAVANAEEATFDPAWVKPGALVASIARGQLPPELAHRARFIASTQTGFAEGGRRGTEAPDTLDPGWRSGQPVGSLADVMKGSVPARVNAEDSVLFMLMGIPAVDAAMARHALEWALRSGVGTQVRI